MFTRLCALALAILAASPFTAPFATCDLSALLPAAHRKAVHTGPHDLGRSTSVDVHGVNETPFKRTTKLVRPPRVQKLAATVVSTRALTPAVPVASHVPSSHPPLRI
ncbi:MAG TPA: hypothetical protein VJP86_14815 [Vicinamibacterales bacterium]|jgi:hypothetical protein|nr:hypothetical protein [Vicinamibacterales bacterium]